MASIREHPLSGYWIACLTLPDGRRTQRSTKVPVRGIKAEDIAELTKTFEQALGATVKLHEGAKVKGALDVRESRRLAQRIADAFEDTARLGKAGQLIDTQARKTIADIYALSNREQLASSNIRDFFNSWLKSKEIEADEKTAARYAVVVEQFLEFLGNRAGRDVAHFERNGD